MELIWWKQNISIKNIVYNQAMSNTTQQNIYQLKRKKKKISFLWYNSNQLNNTAPISWWNQTVPKLELGREFKMDSNFPRVGTLCASQQWAAVASLLSYMLDCIACKYDLAKCRWAEVANGFRDRFILRWTFWIITGSMYLRNQDRFSLKWTIWLKTGSMYPRNEKCLWFNCCYRDIGPLMNTADLRIPSRMVVH